MSNKGFTLIEVLVAFFLFVLVMGGAFSGMQQAITVQRDALEKRAAVEELSFAMEYLARALRGAQKDLAGDCLPAGYTFEATTRIRWLDRNNRCREIFSDAGHDFSERISSDSTPSFGTPRGLISNDFDADVFWFRVFGEYQGDAVDDPDYIQPHVTIGVLLRSNHDNRELVSMQTTISTRVIDVEQ
ncbi:MAG TPA: prepilin-type N-terminal cleavage/methylation domain-containing protein [Candidatus Paceibacterota bacterium]|nr:prepilin-type N-terminal cleavage/methylation domain-containing protein [Candidatus Paceibacterota bacterium]